MEADELQTEGSASTEIHSAPADEGVQDAIFKSQIDRIARSLAAAFILRKTELTPECPDMLRKLFPSAKVFCLAVQEDGGRLISRATSTSSSYHRFSVVAIRRSAMGRAIMGRRIRRFDITRIAEFDDLQDLNTCFGCLSMLCGPVLSETNFPISKKAAEMGDLPIGLTAVVAIGFAVRKQDMSLREVCCLSQIAEAVGAELRGNEEAVDKSIREMWQPLLMPAVPQNRRRRQRAQAFAQHWFWLSFTNKWIEGEFRRFAAHQSILVDQCWYTVGLAVCLLYGALPGESSCGGYLTLKAFSVYLAPLLYIFFNRTGYVERRELLIIGSNLLLVLSTTFGSMNLLGITIGGSTCGGWAIGSESTGKEDDASLRHSLVMLQLAVTSIILSVRMWLFIPFQVLCLAVINGTLPSVCKGLDTSGDTADCVYTLQWSQLLPFGLVIPWVCAFFAEHRMRIAFREERLKEGPD